MDRGLIYRAILTKTNRSKIFFFIIILMACLSGCNILRFGDPERKVQKHQDKEEKKLKKAYQKDVKQQYKMQTRETRKRMNKNLRKVNKDFKRKKSKAKWQCS